MRWASLLAAVVAALLALGALYCNSLAWASGCIPDHASARPVAQALAVAAFVILLSSPVLCVAGIVVTRGRGGGWRTVNATLFVLWWPVAYNAWILLGTIAHGGCDSS
jgi:hypothetical protein